MVFYVLSVFLSAYLLFQVQPMISRYILPFFGGTPAVWSTVQLFFEIFLTGGYAYAAWLARSVPPKRQVWIHVSVLAASLALLGLLAAFWPSPVTPDASWQSINAGAPILDIFKLLLVAVGMPYFMLSTNSPLMQAWFSRAQPGRSPYWLYALSNTGSLLGLLAYPFLIEPRLTLKEQGWMWAGGYALFALIAGWSTIRSHRLKAGAAPAGTPLQPAPPAPRPGVRLQALWIILSAIGTAMLLATTSQITQDVAPIPFLWVLPLAMYLVSFILCFSSERWYSRKVFAGLMVMATAGYAWALLNPQAQFISLITVYCFILFVGVMICSGETYRLRPHPAYLTRFYLMISIGGALGGAAVNLAAPLVFKGYWELPVSFGLVWALLLALFVARRVPAPEKKVRFIFNVLAAAVILLAGGLSAFSLAGGKTSGDVFEARNFYGVVRVKEINPADPQWRGYDVVHGITIHGLQFTAPDKSSLPTVYYTEDSGVGLALLNHPKYGKGMRVGVLGLGIGTLAAYGQANDVYRMYEINPIMVDLANGQEGYFSFLAGSHSQITVVPGDARISLQRELAENGPDHFDLLVLDVFSSDSIPVHLVTSEAFDLYLKHLNPEGILAVNISNRYLDLVPVLWGQASYFNLAMRVIPSEASGQRQYASSWVLLARDPSLFQIPAILQRATATTMEGHIKYVPRWTDDFSNLLQILK